MRCIRRTTRGGCFHIVLNFYAINIPIQVDIDEIYIFLDEFVETDDLDYDTGYLAQ